MAKNNLFQTVSKAQSQLNINFGFKNYHPQKINKL